MSLCESGRAAVPSAAIQADRIWVVRAPSSPLNQPELSSSAAGNAGVMSVWLKSFPLNSSASPVGFHQGVREAVPKSRPRLWPLPFPKSRYAFRAIRAWSCVTVRCAVRRCRPIRRSGGWRSGRGSVDDDSGLQVAGGGDPPARALSMARAISLASSSARRIAMRAEVSMITGGALARRRAGHRDLRCETVREAEVRYPCRWPEAGQPARPRADAAPSRGATNCDGHRHCLRLTSQLNQFLD